MSSFAATSTAGMLRLRIKACVAVTGPRNRESKFSGVTKTIQSLGIKEISAIEATDLFRGKNVPAGKYSLLVRVTFQSREATLTEAQIGDFSGKIISALEKNLGAILRAS